jgi:hypothetical protein
VWWPRVKFKTSRAELSKLQGQLEAEAIAGINRLVQRHWKPKSEDMGMLYMSRGMQEEPILEKGTDKMIPKRVYEYDIPFTARFPDRS